MKNIKCFITGCEGFIGANLADFLIKKDLQVHGMVYADASNIKHLGSKLKLHQCDLRDKQKVNSIITAIKPDYIFHLAAQSFVSVSWEDPEQTLMTNVMGTFNLMESVRKAGINPVIVIVGSSSIYGPREKKEMPLHEDDGFQPTSMYSVSKVSEDMLGYFYEKVYGMKVIRVRPFNMTGPGKIGDACSDFSKTIVEIEKGLKNVIEVGNLETTRDFTDGRDAVNAFWLLAEKGKVGEVYNLCSGKGYQMSWILEKFISLSKNKIKYRVVREKVRPYDDPIYIGDNAKLRRLGWKQQIPMEKTLNDMLEYWRKIIPSK